MKRRVMAARQLRFWQNIEGNPLVWQRIDGFTAYF